MVIFIKNNELIVAFQNRRLKHKPVYISGADHLLTWDVHGPRQEGSLRVIKTAQNIISKRVPSIRDISKV